VYEGTHDSASSQQGLVSHLLGAVTDHGMIGPVLIGPDHVAARERYEAAVTTLDRATT